MEHTKHIWRAVLLLLAMLVTTIFARHFLIPKSFGERGHYRADSLKDYMNIPIRHGGKESCVECHEEDVDACAKSKHAVVSCEACHGPLARHAKDGEKIADALVDKSNRGCGICHEQLAARSTNFPQVVMIAHVAEMEDTKDLTKLEEEACFECHEAHDPSP